MVVDPNIGRIEADFGERICVGKLSTRSTISTFFSQLEFSMFCRLFKMFVRNFPKTIKHLSKSYDKFVYSLCWVTNCYSSAA